MSKVSRRSIAKYAAEQLISGKSSNLVAKMIAGYLIDSKRTGDAEFLLGDIYYELENSGQLAKANVVSANELGAKIEQHVADQVKKQLGVKDVLVENKVDRSVIGGLRIETAGRVWDTTVSKKLNHLSEQFNG